MPLKGQVESIRQKAIELFRIHEFNPNVVVSGSGFLSGETLLRYHGVNLKRSSVTQTISISTKDSGMPYIHIQCNGSGFELEGFFGDILNPTELELEEFELETGMPFILTKKGFSEVGAGGLFWAYLSYLQRLQGLVRCATKR